jgi:hypothetical protein
MTCLFSNAGMNNEKNDCYQQLAQMCTNVWQDCCTNPGGNTVEPYTESQCPIYPPPEFGLTFDFERRRLLQNTFQGVTFGGGSGCGVGCYAE